jgi:hypothetical protein
VEQNNVLPALPAIVVICGRKKRQHILNFPGVIGFQYQSSKPVSGFPSGRQGGAFQRGGKQQRLDFPALFGSCPLRADYEGGVKGRRRVDVRKLRKAGHSLGKILGQICMDYKAHISILEQLPCLLALQAQNPCRSARGKKQQNDKKRGYSLNFSVEHILPILK